MPNVNDVFPSKYLKTSDLAGTEPVVTIDRVEWEPVGRDREMKAVVYFAGKKKGIVLNKTNANKIVEISGSAMTEEWAGTKIKLYAAEANFGGDTYDVVRVKAATNGKPAMAKMTPTPKAAPKPAPVVEPDPEFVDDGHVITDDEIPF